MLSIKLKEISERLEVIKGTYLVQLTDIENKRIDIMIYDLKKLSHEVL